MDYIRYSKPRRKFQHNPTDLDELSKLLKEGPGSSIKSKEFRGKEVDCSKDKKSNSKSAGHLIPSKTSSKLHKKTQSAPSLSSKPLGGKRSNLNQESSKISANNKLHSLDPITFKIGNVSYEMDTRGQWTTNMNSATFKEELSELRTSNRAVYEENNLLRVKNELLLDMITKKNLRIKRVEKDLLRLRKVLSSSSLRFSSKPKKSKK